MVSAKDFETLLRDAAGAFAKTALIKGAISG
jgi:hypothetical protein